MGCRSLQHNDTCTYTRSIVKRINPTTEQQILARILLGYPYSDIAQSTGVAVSTIKKIKARNKTRYEVDDKELKQWSSDEAKVSLQRTYKLLNSVLDEAERGIRKLSTKELILIANQMIIHEQIASATSNNGPLRKKQQNIEMLLSRLKK